MRVWKQLALWNDERIGRLRKSLSRGGELMHSVDGICACKKKHFEFMFLLWQSNQVLASSSFFLLEFRSILRSFSYFLVSTKQLF